MYPERTEPLEEPAKFSNSEIQDEEAEIGDAEEPATVESVPASSGEESGSSSTSSSSEESEPDEVIEPSRTAQVFEWKPQCTIYVNKRTRALHLLPDGGKTDSKVTSFVCGRQLTGDTILFNSRIFSSNWRCKQCDSGKDVRTIDQCVNMLDEAFGRRQKTK